MEKPKPFPFGIVNEEMVKISQTIKIETEDLSQIREFHEKEVATARDEGRDPPTMSDTYRLLLRRGLQTAKRGTTEDNVSPD